MKFTNNMGKVVDTADGIPDVWHIAMSLDKAAQNMVLELWHLAHDMKKELETNGDKS